MNSDLPDAPSPAPPVFTSEAPVAAGAWYALAMLTLMCAMGGVFVMGAMMPNYLIDYLGLSPQEMGLITSAIGFGGALGVAQAVSTVNGHTRAYRGRLSAVTGLSRNGDVD